MLKVNSITFEVNNSCNLNCIHCFQSANEIQFNSLTYSVLNSATTQAKLFGAKCIILSGGEILIHPDWKKMAECVLSNNLHLNMMTNGLKINENFCRFFSEKNKQQFSITISIDGPTSEVNDLIRGGGTFIRSIKIFELLNKRGLIDNVTLQVVIKKNCISIVNKFVTFAKKYSIKRIVFLFIQKWGRAHKNWQVVGLSPNDIQTAQWKIQKLKEDNNDINIISFIDHVDFRKLSPINRCSFGDDLYVDSSGRLFGCDGCYGLEELSLGNLNNNKLFHILRSETFLKLSKIPVERSLGIKECRVCPVVKSCAGGCMVTAYRRNKNLMANDGMCYLRLGSS